MPMSFVSLLVILVFLGSARAAPRLDVDGQRVVDQLTRLATFTDDPNPAVTRILFTPMDMLARSYVKELMLDSGLSVREDSVGNIFGRWEGSEAGAGAVLTGSHCDAIPLAGMYDGTVGVIGPIEALAALRRAGFRPRRPLEVLMFSSEEPTRFALSCSGSRAMAGTLTPDSLAAKRDENGTDFLQAATAAGYGGGSYEEMLAAALVTPGAVSHFVELHIEQGPLLEREGVDIGVVTAIAAPAALEVQLHGDGGHAGALLMPFRNDAGLAAAEVALAVEGHALATGSIDTVATTGVFEVRPGAVNSVPRDVRLGIDVRDIDGARRDRVVQAIRDSVTAIADKRKVRSSVTLVNQDPPTACSPDITAAIAEAATELGLSTKHMVSRAYHDSTFMSRIAPTAMIFVPCKNGWSHRPDEFASVRDIENGVTVLALTMAKLSGGTWPSDRSEL
ncbi:N-carbamyl-L-amino acid amidohydrolase [Haematococcus lacustris]